MKTLICLALCAFIVSATSPVDGFHSGLELLDMQHLMDSDSVFDLSVSFTYIAGTDGSSSSSSSSSSDSNSDTSSSSSSSSDLTEVLTVNGNYNLIVIEDDGQANITTNSFTKTKNLTLQGAVNITGSGTFSARGAQKKGTFNGGSSTDYTYYDNAGFVVGSRGHIFGGEFADDKHNGQGFIEYKSWQDVNTSAIGVEYNFFGSKSSEYEYYSGKTKGEYDVTTNDGDEYYAYTTSVFHAEAGESDYSVHGHYRVEVYDSDGNEVYHKSGPFSQNGSSGEMFGSYRSFDFNDQVKLDLDNIVA